MYAQLPGNLQSDSVRYVANFALSQPVETASQVSEAATPTHCGRKISDSLDTFHARRRIRLNFVYTAISLVQICAQHWTDPIKAIIRGAVYKLAQSFGAPPQGREPGLHTLGDLLWVPGSPLRGPRNDGL